MMITAAIKNLFKFIFFPFDENPTPGADPCRIVKASPAAPKARIWFIEFRIRLAQIPVLFSIFPMAEINSVSEAPVPQTQAEMKVPKKTASPIPDKDTQIIKVNCING